MSKKFKILVCTKGKKCPKRGSEAVADAIESAAQKLNCADDVSVKRCKCMDMCKKGPAVVLMPDKVKYARVSEEDAKEIVNTLITGGEPIKRLRYKKKKK